MKLKVKKVQFDEQPQVSIRVISESDEIKDVKNKKEYPFILNNSINVFIDANIHRFSFPITRCYQWNGADIPHFLFIFGQSKDNNYLIASMVHDYMLQFKEIIYSQHASEKFTPSQYRKLTTLVFREILKMHKTNTIKANIMAFAVDVFQKYCQFNKWKSLGKEKKEEKGKEEVKN